MPANIPIPPGFLDRMSHYLGDEFPAFEKSLNSTPVTGLRVNTLKILPGEFKSRAPFHLGEPIPWAPAAFFLPPGNAQPGLHPYHSAGLFYLQDPSAMAPAFLLDPQPGERVLDLAAAPGGKATALAALMKGEGLLVVNEIKDKRLGHLVMNMERWAAPNVLITNETPERLAAHFGPYFDKVLVDAPCSGEGMFRKDIGARLDWSPKMVEGCAERQMNILKVAAQLVRPGGILLYSTCTFNPEENEEVILKFLGEFPMFQVSQLHQYPGFLPGQPGWVSSFSDEEGRVETLAGAVRLFPHRLPGEGHFICSLTRTTDANIGRLNSPHVREYESHLQDMDSDQVKSWQEFSHQALQENWETNRLQVRNERLYFMPTAMPSMGSLRVTSPGIWLGTFKKNRFEPAHPFALFLYASRVTNVINIEPGDSKLQAYLRGESLQSPGDPGWCLVCVDGFGLGWGKRVQGMAKNHYPRGWIRY